MTDQIREARLRLLRMHYESGVGHIGGNLSCLDILMTLHQRVMEDQDLFVLSKGHSAGALYVSLWAAGKLSDEDLGTFHKDDTRLPGHPSSQACDQILFSTGSLGHGLSLACGTALGQKLQGSKNRTFCLLSDGELNEGSTWEALHFMAHQCLDNLTVVIDNNGLQGFGSTKDVMNLGPLEERLACLGLELVRLDGHDPVVLEEELTRPSRCPKLIIADTVKGRGVSFMENAMEWHYLPLSKDTYEQAASEVRES